MFSGFLKVQTGRTATMPYTDTGIHGCRCTGQRQETVKKVISTFIGVLCFCGSWCFMRNNVIML